MAKYDRSNDKSSRPNGNLREGNLFAKVAGGRRPTHAVIRTGSIKMKSAWATDEGDSKVIHAVGSVSFTLKKEVGNSFVAFGARLDVMAKEIEQWLTHQWGVRVSVRRINHLLFRVKPLFATEFQKLL